MTIEQSNGKARPTLPRSSDLRVVQSERNPSEGRAARGLFAAGNQISRGARWKASIKRLLGRSGDDAVSEAVGRDAWKIYLATLRAMPNDAAPVRSLVALHSRHVAVSGYFTTKAAEAGLETERGLALLAIASHHGQRAERTAVTALDVATKLAASQVKGPTDPLAAFMSPKEATR